MLKKVTECKSCEKEVSKTARTCPHCGQENPGINTGKGCLIIIVIAVVIASLIMLIDNGSPQENKDAKQETTSDFESDSEVLKNAMETIANNVALKGGVKITTECINLAMNSEVITFKCVSQNTRQSISFKQKFERDESSSIGWKPVWNDRVDKAISSLEGYSKY